MKNKKILFMMLLLQVSMSAFSKMIIKTPAPACLVVNKVLIVGNSIVEHDPAPSIGWTGNWGMAASVRDSDFVHILTRKIQAVNNNCLVKFVNIAEFERNYTTYNLNKLKIFRAFKPDMIIIKISENVNDSTSNENNFLGSYKKLLQYLDPNGKSVKVIVDGFWIKPNVNKIVKQVAIDGKYDFISITELSYDVSNTAKGKFAHAGVAAHPSDKGMRLIAERIWDTIKKYF